jgi:selenocysteine-specific elongation factor
VARVAVNLRGVDRTDVARGCALVAPGAWLLTDVLDVRLRPGDPTARGPEMLMLHAGAAQTPARVRPLGPDTARLTLAGPLPLRVGDRVLLRDPAGHRVVAGATVLDPRPPRLHRRGAAAARARELGGMSGVPDGAAEVRRRGLVGVGELRAMGAEPPASARRVGDWLVGLQRLVELRADLCRLVEQHSEAHPLDAGLPVEAARARLGLPDARIVAALVGPGLEMDSGRVRPAGSRGTLPPAVERAVTAVQRDLGASPFAAPEAGRLAALGLGPREVGAAVRAGRLLAVAEGIVLLPDAPMRAVAALGAGPQPFSVSEARQLLGTTRRIAVPLLELLDRRGLTRRLPDDRRTLVPPGAAP